MAISARPSRRQHPRQLGQGSLLARRAARPAASRPARTTPSRNGSASARPAFRPTLAGTRARATSSIAGSASTASPARACLRPRRHGKSSHPGPDVTRSVRAGRTKRAVPPQARPCAQNETAARTPKSSPAQPASAPAKRVPLARGSAQHFRALRLGDDVVGLAQRLDGVLSCLERVLGNEDAERRPRRRAARSRRRCPRRAGAPAAPLPR